MLGATRDVTQDAGGEATAERRCFNIDRKWLFRRSSSGEGGVERREWEVVDCRGFAGDAVVIHRVDAVGGDVHLKKMAVAGA